MNQLSLESKAKLNNELEIPLLGLGTYLVNNQECYTAVRHTLKIGYRHIDTAAFYGNEKEIGKAIRDDELSWEEIFVTTKLWNSDHGYDNALKAFEESFEKLNIDYIDLYLIHWPVTGLRNDSWRALEDIYKEGKCKAIGVSNYTIRHLEELLKITKVIPVVNQVEFHPFLYQKKLLDFCKSKNIWIEAYSPLTKRQKLNDPVLLDIAGKYSKLAAQIMIRWCLERDVIVLPKSSNTERIKENANVYDFNLTENDLNTIDSLNKNWHVTWDPTNEP